MGEFIFDTSKEFNLSEKVPDDFITLTKIELIEGSDHIYSDVIFWEQTFNDGSFRRLPISLGAYNLVGENAVQLEYDIENSSNSKLTSSSKTNKYKIYYETFLESIKRKEQQNLTQKQKFALEKQRWVTEVDKLYDNIVGWLNMYQGIFQTTRGKTQIKEELLGTYEIGTLTIRISDVKRIDFMPIATYITGGYGRIDLQFRGMNFNSAM